MFKKIMAASVVLSFIACSSVDDGFVYGSSDSQGNGEINDSSSSQDSPSSSSSLSSSSSEPEPSSSSKGPEEVLISDLGSNGGKSDLFGTFPYGYALKAGEDEDLTQFWKPECSPKQTDTISVADANNCMLDQKNAILQNRLTTKGAPLHYIISGFTTENPSQKAIQLTSYNLIEAGDQAALGLDVSENGLEALAGVVAFTYNYKGGAHKFRIANDANYWEADVVASTEETLVEIKVSDLIAADETPFDISKATSFLWVVEYDANTEANNKGNLMVFLLNGLVEE